MREVVGSVQGEEDYGPNEHIYDEVERARRKSKRGGDETSVNNAGYEEVALRQIESHTPHSPHTPHSSHIGSALVAGVPTRFTIALRGFSLLAPDHSAHAPTPAT